jgi:hypothetical protein
MQHCAPNYATRKKPSGTGILVWQLLATLMVLTISSCSSGRNLRLNEDDLNALRHVYDTSPGTFRYSQVQVHVREGGGVDVVFHGPVAAKATNDEEQEPLWIPLILLSELPEYFQVTDASNKQTTLEAYKVTGGLWCITALVPPPYANALEIDLLLASRNFSSRLPFLVPAQGRGSVAISIAIPKTAQFSSTELTTSASVQPVPLSVLPASVSKSEGAITAGTTVAAQDAVAWNFSGVTYSSARFASLQPWFTPTALLLIFMTLSVWYGTWLYWNNEQRLFVDDSVSKLLNAIATTTALVSSEKKERDPLGLLDVEIVDFESRMSGKGFAVGGVHLRPNRAIDHIKDLLLKLKAAALTSTKSTQHAEYETQIIGYVERLTKIEAQFREASRRRRTCRTFFLVFSAAALMALLWLLATIASAQTATPPTASKTVGNTTLSELGIALAARDPHSADYDQVSVGLKFLPLTDVRGQQSTQSIEIRTGKERKFTIMSVDVPASRGVSVGRKTDKTLTLQVPVTYSPLAPRLKTLAEMKVVEFNPPPEYFDIADKTNQVSVNYVIKGAQTVNERARNGWFHWFPLDTLDVEVPIELGQASVLSGFELQRPSFDYIGDITAESLNRPFVITDGGRSYKIAGGNDTTRMFLWPGEVVTVKGTFKRHTLQRLGLTWGVIGVALIIGALLGWVLTLPEKSWIATLIGVFGVAAPPIGTRSAVLAAHPDLPNILSGQGMTFFEAIFILSMVVILGTALAVRAKLK